MTNKNVPDIRFDDFTDDWEQRKVDGYASFLTGSGLSWDDITDDGEQDCILYGNLYTDYGMITDKVVYKTNTTVRNPVYSKYGDVLIPASDTTPTGLARATSLEKSDVLLGGDINIIRPNEDINGSCLSLALNANKKELIRLIKGTTVRHIHNSEIKDIELFLPISKEEQTKIAEYFKSLDNLITLHQRKHEKLNTIKQSLLEKMFPKEGESKPEIRFAGFTEPWEQRKLGDIGTTFTGLSGKTKEDFGHGDARFVTYMNVYSNPVTDPAMVEPVEIDSKQKQVEVGDVFFTTSSETPDEVGMSSVLLEKHGPTYLNSFCFGYRPTEIFDPYYLAYMLRSDVVRKRIILLAQGISRYNISKNKMMEIEIPVPSLSEQKKVGACFKELDDLITLHQRELVKLKNIKKALLNKMFV